MATDVAGKCDVAGDFDLAFDRFDEAAQVLADASGCFIHVDDLRAAALRPNPVSGRMSRREMLEQLTAGTPLRIVARYPDRIGVEPAPAPPAPSASASASVSGRR